VEPCDKTLVSKTPLCTPYCFLAACSYDASGKSGNASTPEQLDALLHEIGSDKARYEAMLAWKQRKVRHHQHA
jgi:hypothetical protein